MEKNIFEEENEQLKKTIEVLRMELAKTRKQLWDLQKRTNKRNTNMIICLMRMTKGDK